jgi:hypothetical protein
MLRFKFSRYLRSRCRFLVYLCSVNLRLMYLCLRYYHYTVYNASDGKFYNVTNSPMGYISRIGRATKNSLLHISCKVIILLLKILYIAYYNASVVVVGNAEIVGSAPRAGRRLQRRRVRGQELGKLVCRRRQVHLESI